MKLFEEWGDDVKSLGDIINNELKIIREENIEANNILRYGLESIEKRLTAIEDKINKL